MPSQPKQVGLARASKKTRKRVSSAGGKAAHEAGTANVFDEETAAKAGRKGGKAAHKAGTANVFTPEKAREAAKKSAEVRRAKREAQKVDAPPDVP